MLEPVKVQAASTASSKSVVSDFLCSSFSPVPIFLFAVRCNSTWKAVATLLIVAVRADAPLTWHCLHQFNLHLAADQGCGALQVRKRHVACRVEQSVYL